MNIDEVTGEILGQAEETPFWKTPWNHDRDAEARRTGLACKDKSLTQQQFAEEADINRIVAKFLETGIPPDNLGTPTFVTIEGDGSQDLQDVIVTQAQVDQAWNALPAAVRNILRDPATFVDYVDHCVKTGDLDPLRELGLAKQAESPPEPRSKEDQPKETSPPPKAPETPPKTAT